MPRTASGRALCRHLPKDLALVRLPDHGLREYLARLAGAVPDEAVMAGAPRDEALLAAIVACPVRGRAIAAAYRAGPDHDDAALAAYRAFRAETAAQFDRLTRARARGGLGIHVRRRGADPYPDAAAMAAHVAATGTLDVYATGGAGNHHPLLCDEDNDMFRAVHDVFGHLASGRGFDRHGEEAAWYAHSRRYSALARRAMTTETRGQSSAFIWCYGGRRFPVQKVLLLPYRFCDPAAVSVAWGLPNRAGHQPQQPRRGDGGAVEASGEK